MRAILKATFNSKKNPKQILSLKNFTTGSYKYTHEFVLAPEEIDGVNDDGTVCIFVSKEVGRMRVKKKELIKSGEKLFVRQLGKVGLTDGSYCFTTCEDESLETYDVTVKSVSANKEES